MATIRAPPDILHIVSNRTDQEVLVDLHQSYALDLHSREKCKNAHNRAGNSPTGTEDWVCFEERQTICDWPERPKYKKTRKDLAVDVSQRLSIS